MNPMEKDDFSHALGQTLEFYNKTLDKKQFSFWYQAVGQHPVAAIKRALLDYTKIGKYAPKPADVIQILENNRHYGAANQLPPPKANPCPPEIEAAWMWFIGMSMAGSKNLGGLFSSHQNISEEQKEKYLRIVNEEAKAHNQPEAIPEKFKLSAVWA